MPTDTLILVLGALFALTFFSIVVWLLVLIYADALRYRRADGWPKCLGCGCPTEPSGLSPTGICAECTWALIQAKRHQHCAPEPPATLRKAANE